MLDFPTPDTGAAGPGLRPAPTTISPHLPRRIAAWLRRRWLRVLPAMAVALLLGYGAAQMLLGPVVAGERVVRADFSQRIVTSGHVEAPFRVNVGSQITGVVSSVPVAEGQTVRAGDILVVLDDREARSAVTQAQSALIQAEARLRQARELTLPAANEALKQARAALKDAQGTYDRAAALSKDGFQSKAVLDSAAKALEIARSQARSTELQFQANRPGGSDDVMIAAQVEQARAALEVARSHLAYTVITAPRDGILISRNVERGNVVHANDILMVLSPSGATELIVQLDERNLSLIALGQHALASADAYAKESFAAEVSYINPAVDPQRAAVEVKLSVPQLPDYLRQDMTVSVDIETARHPQVLTMSARSLREAGSAKPWVLKVDGGRAVRQDVGLGLVSGGQAEILSGLDAGDIVLPANAAVKPGGRVRVKFAAPPRAAP
jgi:HlyD family secretion protein